MGQYSDRCQKCNHKMGRHKSVGCLERSCMCEVKNLTQKQVAHSPNSKKMLCCPLCDKSLLRTYSYHHLRCGGCGVLVGYAVLLVWHGLISVDSLRSSQHRSQVMSRIRKLYDKRFASNARPRIVVLGQKR